MDYSYHYFATGKFAGTVDVKRAGIYVTSKKIRSEDDYEKLRKHIEDKNGITRVLVESLTLIDECKDLYPDTHAK